MKKLLPVPAAALLLAVNACTTAPPAPSGPDRFAMADANGDGQLTADEFNHYAVSGVFVTRDANHDNQMTMAEWNPQMDAAQKKEFKLRDTNKDGMVSLAEAEAYAKKKGTFTKDIKRADADKNGTVSREEARAYYASKEGPFH
jgi:Ca2+-binding EF-hand superfamily protein